MLTQIVIWGEDHHWNFMYYYRRQILDMSLIFAQNISLIAVKFLRARSGVCSSSLVLEEIFGCWI